jgi:hypothetical protein
MSVRQYALSKRHYHHADGHFECIILFARHIIVVSNSSFSFGELVLSTTSSSGVGTCLVVLVQLHEFGEIELRLLEKLNLPDHAVVFKGEDLGALFLDLLTNVVLNKKFDEVLEGVALDL